MGTVHVHRDESDRFVIDMYREELKKAQEDKRKKELQASYLKYALTGTFMAVGTAAAWYYYRKLTRNGLQNLLPEYYNDENRLQAECSRIRDDIRRITRVERINIGLIGYFGAGKSSLINTLLTVFTSFDASISKAAVVADSDETTKRFRVFGPLEGTNVYVIDSIGWDLYDETNSYRNWFRELLQGRFTDMKKKDIQALREEEKRDDEESDEDVLDIEHMNHGVICVSNVFLEKTDMSPFRMELMETLEDMDRSIPIVGALTKLDQICRNVGWFRESEEVKEHVDNSVTAWGLPMFPTFPYNQHDSAGKQDVRRNYLVLLLLKDIVENAVKFKQVSRADARQRQRVW